MIGGINAYNWSVNIDISGRVRRPAIYQGVVRGRYPGAIYGSLLNSFSDKTLLKWSLVLFVITYVLRQMCTFLMEISLIAYNFLYYIQKQVIYI